MSRLPEREENPRGSPDLIQRRYVSGRKPGSKYVKIVRPFSGDFRSQAPGHLVATERVLAPRGRLGHLMAAARAVLVGRRIATEQELHERVNVFKGLAVFASDNISSSAYATEEIMRVLVLAGAGALALTMPITIGDRRWCSRSW